MALYTTRAGCLFSTYVTSELLTASVFATTIEVCQSIVAGDCIERWRNRRRRSPDFRFWPLINKRDDSTETSSCYSCHGYCDRMSSAHIRGLGPKYMYHAGKWWNRNGYTVWPFKSSRCATCHVVSKSRL